MQKELEALNVIKNTIEEIQYYNRNVKIDNSIYDLFDTIKQVLIKAQEQDFNYKNIVIPFFDELTNVLGTNDIDEMLDKIKEQEKVLKIIKDKWVNVAVLIHSKTVDEYNNNAHTPYNLTEEEFDTLKNI